MADGVVLQVYEARVNVTYGGQNGDLPDPVAFDATDADLKTWVAEAMRTAPGIPGIPVQELNLADFVVDRFEATEARPYRLIQLRPKTPFGVREKVLAYARQNPSFQPHQLVQAHVGSVAAVVPAVRGLLADGVLERFTEQRGARTVPLLRLAGQP